jgi:MFS family permease
MRQIQPFDDSILVEWGENTETEVPIMAKEDASYSPPPHGFRTFVLLWAFQSLAAFGFQIITFAITVWLTTGLYPAPEQKALLAAALSMTSLAFGLPQVLVAPFAGVLVDRADRKTVLFWANVGSGLVSLSLVVILAAGALSQAASTCPWAPSSSACSPFPSPTLTPSPSGRP